MNQFSRYRPLVANLARQALAQAGAAGGPAASLDTRLGLPAARVRVHDAPADGAWHAALSQLARLGEADEDDRPLRSPGGQWRDVYWPLVVHLYLRSYAKVRPKLDEAKRGEADEQVVAMVQSIEASPDAGTISFRLWRALCIVGKAGLALPGEPTVRQGKACPAVDELITRADARTPGEALHAQDADEPLDFWTYRELAGLHALHRLALVADRSDWHGRVEQVAAFHLHHTQPDYTTYEPWGLAAFAASVQTSLFAEQQLHDATVHLTAGDRGAAVMIALLLADAFDAMAEV